MRFFIIFLFLVTHAYAMTESFQNMKADRDYMQFALSKYLSWHEKKFPSPLSQSDERTRAFLKRAVSRIDHWMVDKDRELTQIALEHSLKDKRIFQTVRVFLHAELRNDEYVKAQKLPSGFIPEFFTVDDSGKRCFIEAFEKRTSSRVFCSSKNDPFKSFGKEVLADSVTPNWPTPYPFIGDREVRRLNEAGEVISIRYRSRTSHPSRTPRDFDGLINLHVIDAHMSMDTYEVDREGNLTVIYP